MERQATGAIAESVQQILSTIPDDVTLVAAAKGRRQSEIEAVIAAGITNIGHNYVQEARQTITPALRQKATWHMIGHLQKNKVNWAVRLFDVIETLDSVELAHTLDRRCAGLGIIMPVLIEINSGREARKTGVLPEHLEEMVRAVADLEHIEIQGLMTMGPRFGDPQDARPYFRATRRAFERLAGLELPGVTMRTLSMGMSNSYLVAIEEGATMVRIGTRIFGSVVQAG
ncbi:MAG: YggS family pyridoxal phosphate-dependent enzyme [Chloroflexota bacterium]